MRKFINKVQDFGKKAAEFKQAIQSAPAKAAEIREAVVMSAGELYQIRTDVQSSLNGLRANNEERLLAAMRQINDAALVFEEAGYELTGMDLDLATNQRLAVTLDKFEDVSDAQLRALVNRETRETIKSILAGILKAEETAANVELTYLSLTGVIIHVGSIPLVRMCWRTEDAVEEQPATVLAPAPTATPPPIPSSIPAFGSMFEQRTIPSSSVTPTPAPAVVSTPVTASSTPTAAPHVAPSISESSPWSKSALDRFKKMPDLSRHKR